MHSGGFRGFTVVTVVTLIFAPVFQHHHWLLQLVGRTEQTKLEQCASHSPCPQQKKIVEVVTVPAAPAPAPAPRH